MVRRPLALLNSSGFPFICAEGGLETRGVRSGCRLSGTGITWAGTSPGNSHGKVIKRADQEFWILHRLGRASGELRNLQWRRVGSSIERLGLRRREEGSVLEAAGKPPFVGPNGSAASLGVADSPIGAELAGIPARKRQPAKRCLSERERSLGLVDDGGNERPGSSPAGTLRRTRPWANFVTTAKPLAEPRVRNNSSVERPSSATPVPGSAWKLRAIRGWQERMVRCLFWIHVRSSASWTCGEGSVVECLAMMVCIAA
jgi:hypothetical protein